MAKVISTRDVIFNKSSIFDRKVKDLIDSLMHSTLLEIAAHVWTIELPQPILDTGMESFHEDDDSVNTQEEEIMEDPPRYYNRWKI